MKKRIPIGLKSYDKLKKGNYYVVDKTMMICDFLARGNEVTLITRPRRFGKTINISMMAEFFDVTKDAKEIFKDTAIMDTEYAAEMNQYPTIFLSFANAKGDKMTVIQEIREQLLDEYDRFAYVFTELAESDQNRYRKIKEELMSDHEQISYYLLNSLAFLMKQLEKHHGKKVMVFIDEYDTPFIEAHVNGFMKRSAAACLLCFITR